MLFYNLQLVQLLCIVMLLFLLLAIACAGIAYSTNAERADDDPDKKDYHILALLLAPFTWPFFLVAFVSLFLLRALFYGVFLVLFIASLIFFPRKRSEPIWLERTATKIGDALLKANMTLLRLFLRPWAGEPDTI